MSNTPENKSGMPERVWLMMTRPGAGEWATCLTGNKDGLTAYHDAASCAAKMASIKQAIEDRRAIAARMHDIVLRDAYDDILGLLDAAEGKAPEGGV